MPCLQHHRYFEKANSEAGISMKGPATSISRAIPQIKVYETRTDRNIVVFRLARSE
jgi:hypothetical protein